MPSSYVIGDYFENFIKQQMESGRYNSASEIIRDALRLLEEQEKLREIRLDYLRKEIAIGVNSGPGIPAEEVFAELKARYQVMTDAQK
jgi:antitoxin ParD1/3/4